MSIEFPINSAWRRKEDDKIFYVIEVAPLMVRFEHRLGAGFLGNIIGKEYLPHVYERAAEFDGDLR